MIKIIAVSDSHKHFNLPIEEYVKRLGKKVVLKLIKPSKKKNNNEIIVDETKSIIKNLEKEKGFKVLMYINTKNPSTSDLYKLIEEKQMLFSNIIFVIGGAYGVDYNLIKENIDRTVSLSSMTLPHSMALMMLLEQIYRCDCIKKGIRYHH